MQSSMSNCKIQNLYLSLLHTRHSSFRCSSIEKSKWNNSRRILWKILTISIHSANFISSTISFQLSLDGQPALFQCSLWMFDTMLIYFAPKTKNLSKSKLDQEFMIALIKLVNIWAMSLAFWGKGPLTFSMLRKV